MTSTPDKAAGLALEEVTVERADADRPRVAPLVDATAEFMPGEVALISGANGAGKTTVLMLLGGVIRPTKGVVRAAGEPVSRWVTAHRDRWRRDVGIALQTPHLLSGLTVLENVMVRGVPTAQNLGRLRRDATRALAALDMADLAANRIERLSGGERQRVALARALLGSPRYLLLDEPTAHQDDQGLALVVEAMGLAAAEGATVVVTCHDRRLTDADPADLRYRLEGGRLRRDPP